MENGPPPCAMLQNILPMPGNEKKTVSDNGQGSLSRRTSEVIYYTDPLCCWSWAMEPQWRKLQYEYKGLFTVKYKMAGLLPSWKHFCDATNSIQRPAQMGPEWMHAKHVSGMPCNERIWITDPPSSSYPACIAVKCAEAQSQELGSAFLRQLQEAVMVNGQNIAKTEILLTEAARFCLKFRQFNCFDFRDDLLNGTAIDAFRQDLQESKYLGIQRFPTLVFKKNGRVLSTLSGYQGYEVLKKELLRILETFPDVGTGSLILPVSESNWKPM